MAETRKLTVGLPAAGFAVDLDIAADLWMQVIDPADILAETADQEIPFAFDKDKLVCFLAYCDVAATIETNDGTTPDDTLVLPANTPFVWLADGDTDKFANPFSEDVTKLLVSIAGTVAPSRLRIVAGLAN